MAGSELQQNKPPDCIRVELYLLIVVCLCVNSVASMLFLPTVIVIYPAMWVEPHATNTIFVSDAYIKYAKPYAVQKILDNI